MVDVVAEALVRGLDILLDSFVTNRLVCLEKLVVFWVYGSIKDAHYFNRLGSDFLRILWVL